MNHMESGEMSQAKRGLILAAEKLFAKWGIEGASLREIASLAGHGNTNAVRYHFGGREALAEAVFLYRARQFESIREHMLMDAKAHGLTSDIRTLVEMICLPQVRLLNEEKDYSYAAFVLQHLLYRRPRPVTHFSGAPDKGLLNLREVYRLITERLFYVPDEILGARLSNVLILFFSALVDQSRNDLKPTDTIFLQQLDDTLDQMAMVLSLPVSAANWEGGVIARLKGVIALPSSVLPQANC